MPNITEASFLLGRECSDELPMPGADTEALLRDLTGLGADAAVLTGVYSEDGGIGAAYYDSRTGECGYEFSEKHPGFYHGTGDVFGSAFTAATVLGANLREATAEAVHFTERVVRRTAAELDDPKYGPVFEPELGAFAERMAEFAK